MIWIIAAVATLLAIAIMWFWRKVRSAPTGYQDDDGFHFGEYEPIDMTELQRLTSGPDTADAVMYMYASGDPDPLKTVEGRRFYVYVDDGVDVSDDIQRRAITDTYTDLNG